MKLTIQHLGVRSTHRIDSLVESSLWSLAERRRIDEAVVRLEARHEASPPFRVHVHLITPGPDLEVEAADYSIRAAIRKAGDALQGTLDQRERKRAGRARARPQRPVIARTALPHR